ncbi:hypothetical protein FHS27_004150 [Rhodopirellula rubra]|uniref:Uncharacterized protein n=1 Tax=Aporhodopirellula rubra TaxID=980271 RepID=A0A7W5E2W6_9BACT|nr:hypothetical protein [Aporhodopirellula rubra]MBB3208322.1 hypothetical protein [Aporhodopirellula rubra]
MIWIPEVTLLMIDRYHGSQQGETQHQRITASSSDRQMQSGNDFTWSSTQVNQARSGEMMLKAASYRSRNSKQNALIGSDRINRRASDDSPTLN